MKLLPYKTTDLVVKFFFSWINVMKSLCLQVIFPTKFYLSYSNQLIFNIQTFPPTI